MEGSTVSTHKPSRTIKFLCSYGGKILPRYPDGKLRYYGGETRLLAVGLSLSYRELAVKLGELCGTPVTLRCQLPTEDLDALVTIISDEDLANLVEEYDRTSGVQSSSSLKIRAFLSLTKKSSPNPSPRSPLTFASSSPPRSTIAMRNNCNLQMLQPPRKLPFRCDKSGGNLLRYACENSGQSYLVHGGNHWQ